MKRKATSQRRSSTRKRGRSSAKKRSYRSLYVPRGPVPLSTTVRMRYCESIKLNPGIGGTLAFTSFSANSIYDPNSSGTGHQPYGHDTYEQLYNHYLVLGSKITATFVSTDTTSSAGTQACGIKLDDDLGTLNADKDAICEQSDVKYAVLKDSRNGGLVKLKQYYSPKSFFNLNQSAVAARQAQLGAQFGVNPSEGTYFRLFTAPLDPLANSGEVLCHIEIEYMVRCTEPKDISQS